MALDKLFKHGPKNVQFLIECKEFMRHLLEGWVALTGTGARRVIFNSKTT
jgi:hypothetical protein